MACDIVPRTTAHRYKLTDVETMLAWANSMTWKGVSPLVNLSHKVYQKGISLPTS